MTLFSVSIVTTQPNLLIGWMKQILTFLKIKYNASIFIIIFWIYAFIEQEINNCSWNTTNWKHKDELSNDFTTACTKLEVFYKSTFTLNHWTFKINK